MLTRILTCSAALALATASVACGDEAPPPPPPPPAGDAPAGGAAPAAQPGARGAAKGATAPADLPPIPPREIGERDFLESPTNRDPFRSFEELFTVKPATSDSTKIQREVLVAKYALEELKIVGIVAGNAGRVLVADPTGLGWVLRVGDFVGKPEVVHSGGSGGTDVAVNWRVDRIRDNDVVFVREDPSRPDVPPTTRVLSLHTQDELKREIRTGIRGSRPDEGGEDRPKAKGGG